MTVFEAWEMPNRQLVWINAEASRLEPKPSDWTRHPELDMCCKDGCSKKEDPPEGGSK
jgi:hypothetical protein